MLRRIALVALLAFLGLALEFCGARLNYAVIMANGGQMPVWTLSNSLVLLYTVDPLHRPLRSSDKYKALADVLPSLESDWSGHPQFCMMSLGDVLIDAGGFLFFIAPLAFVWTEAKKLRRCFVIQSKRPSF